MPNEEGTLANHLTDDRREPTKVDMAAAESCRRSGTFALLLTLALFAGIPYWLQRPKEAALGESFNPPERYSGGSENMFYGVVRVDTGPTAG